LNLIEGFETTSKDLRAARARYLAFPANAIIAELQPVIQGE
jgi:hypothetical protein